MSPAQLFNDFSEIRMKVVVPSSHFKVNEINSGLAFQVGIFLFSDLKGHKRENSTIYVAIYWLEMFCFRLYSLLTAQ